MSVHARRITRAGAAVGLAVLFLVMAVWVGTLQLIDYERRHEAEDARRHVENLALAVEQHVASTLRSADQILRGLDREYQTYGRWLNLPEVESAGFVQRGVFTFVGIADADGKLVPPHGSSVRTDVSDREYFKAARAAASDGMIVGKPLIGRVSGRTEIPLVRPHRNHDGTFGGVALVGLDPRHFSAFFSRLDLGRRPLVEMVRLDGVSLARWDGERQTSGRDAAGTQLFERAAAADHGSYLSRGLVDGVPRIISFRVLRAYGVIVLAGSSVEHAMGGFEKHRRTYLALATGASLFLLLLGAAIVILVERQARALSAAREAESALYLQLDELRRFQAVTVDRELRMIELEGELARLKRGRGWKSA